MPPRSISLLGPQTRRPNLVSAVEALSSDGSLASDGSSASDGRLAVITAGWQERELEIEELDEHLGRATVNLALYRRSDELFARSPELLEGLWKSRAVLEQIQAAYTVQLSGALDAARTLLSMDVDDGVSITDYQDDAIAVVRGIDEHHFARLTTVHAELEAQQGYDTHDDVLRHREELREALAGCSGLLVAGGHVLVLLNRLRMFDLAGSVGDLPVIAWSAGAMAVSERVVLFHHSPPQGHNNTELAAPGLGICKGLVPFPHAARRLEVHDPKRLSLLARRFAPDQCVTLDHENRVDFNGSQWSGTGARRLTESGTLEPLEVVCP